jgi:hypothetical protein
LDSNEVDELTPDYEDVPSILEKLERRQAYKDAKARLQQYEAVPTNKRSEEETALIETARAIVEDYEENETDEEKEKRLEQEALVARAREGSKNAPPKNKPKNASVPPPAAAAAPPPAPKNERPVSASNVNVGFGKNENWAGGKRRTRKNKKSTK